MYLKLKNGFLQTLFFEAASVARLLTQLTHGRCRLTNAGKPIVGRGG